MSQSYINSETQWMGSDPFLRLFHALANFNFLESYLEKGEEKAEVAFAVSQLTKHKWQRVSDLFNDHEWRPKTLYLPSLHPDFDKAHEIPPFSRKETSEQLFNRFQKAKSQMEALRLWCINDQSVKGKYATAMSVVKSSKHDEKFSSMSAFPSHLLYLWHYSDSYKAVKELFQLPLIINPSPEKKSPKKRLAFNLNGDQGVTGPNAVRMLQIAEQHHLELAENFGYILSKLSVVGGKHYDALSKVVDDLADRVNAAHQRVLNLEKSVMEG